VWFVLVAVDGELLPYLYMLMGFCDMAIVVRCCVVGFACQDEATFNVRAASIM
jgi:hypothetical protein